MTALTLLPLVLLALSAAVADAFDGSEMLGYFKRKGSQAAQPHTEQPASTVAESTPLGPARALDLAQLDETTSTVSADAITSQLVFYYSLGGLLSSVGFLFLFQIATLIRTRFPNSCCGVMSARGPNRYNVLHGMHAAQYKHDNLLANITAEDLQTWSQCRL
ncbi:unnamed protein product [Amoebophrya sp. A120]|nr:unnamed protein product [Amoebophrya sp. A120]|eukprot:GSA120T00004150001.1